ncbi:sodium/solute symporter [Streptomyces sp. NPDC001450]
MDGDDVVMSEVMHFEGPGASFLGSGAQTAVLVSFLAFAGLSLLLCVLAAPERDEVADFYAANRSLTPFQAAIALVGGYMSAATLLSTTGLVAVVGYDGLVLVLSTSLALGVLLILAGPLRNAGRFTIGDILALRMPGAAPRIAAALATLAVSLPFLVVQLSGVGSATALLIGLENPGAQKACIVFVGTLMICYPVLGGMRGTSVVQILKVVIVFGAVAAVAVLVLNRFHWNVNALLAAATRGSGRPDVYLHSGLQLGQDPAGRLDFFGTQLTVVLGLAVMPHMITQINSVADGAAARRASRYALTAISVFCLLVVIAGLGAAALVGDRTITAVDPKGQMSLLLLAGGLEGGTANAAGSALFTAVACAVFVAVLGVVAGAALSAAAALAHDVHAHAVRRGRLTEMREIRSARWSGVGIGGLSILLATLSQGYNVNFLSSLALAVAASSVLPAVVYTLFWQRYNRTGLLWTVYGGLATSIGLNVFSPAVSGTPFALFPHNDFHWYPMQTPGVVSIPTAFLLGWVGSVVARGRRADDGQAEPGYAEAEFGILTGVGGD